MDVPGGQVPRQLLSNHLTQNMPTHWSQRCQSWKKRGDKSVTVLTQIQDETLPQPCLSQTQLEMALFLSFPLFPPDPFQGPFSWQPSSTGGVITISFRVVECILAHLREKGFFSPCFLIPEGKGVWRPILDLKLQWMHL